MQEIDSLNVLAMTISNTVFIIVPIWTLALSYLMVSQVRYPHVTKQLIQISRLSPAHSFYRLVQITFSIVIILVLHELALPILFMYYVVGSPMLDITRRATTRIRSRSNNDHAGLADPEMKSEEVPAGNGQDAHRL